MRLPLFALLVAAFGLSLGHGPSVAHAQGAAAAQADASVSMEIVVLHGTNDGTGIDPKIGKMPELAKPPFSSYNSYKLLDRSKQTSSKASPSTLKLPNDRVLKVSLKDVVQPSKKGESKRYVISASIQKPGGSDFLPLLEVNAKAGETFFVAGQNHKGGVLVIGIKVNP
ncbi:hypothetical protein [Polyangium spumosum]|uniref:Secreted protein n=1 Tax=Polyangium spumosum TaxID=889282 RepID=A0A6N7PRG8_9BACT|nr:hypothetical protein [Polyangium spumosum]MRG92714.1 hypothetical protein [Polyangium spumosum]